MKKTVLVTGGRGFIGSHLVDSLVDKYNVIAVDRLRTSQFDNPNAKYIQKSICNLDDRDLNLRPGELEYVFHLAAISRIEYCRVNPNETVETNIYGTQILLDLAARLNCKKFVYSSTSCVYGLNPRLPISEENDLEFLNSYAYTKYCAELLVKSYSELYGLSSVALRYFNVFGERSPDNSSYCPVVGVFSKQKASGAPLTIVGDGEQRRDFIYVGDVCKANILAAQNTLDFEVFNIGSGRNHSINEVANLFNHRVEYIGAREGESRNTLADISKAKRLLGWEPTVFLDDWIANNA